MSTTSSMTELQRMTKTELRREIATKRGEYAKVRLHVQSQGEKNHAKMKLMRREIARMTMVYEKMPDEATAQKVEKTASVKPKKPVKASRSKAK